MGLCVSGLSAQDKQLEQKIALEARLTAQQLENQRVAEERQRVQERVKQLAAHAQAFRSEFNFDEAAKVEAEIRSLCWSFDPRVIRANDLKNRAVEARLSGRILDADMYEREATKILQELKSEYAAAEEPIRSTKDSRLLKEVETLRAQVVELTNELYRLQGELKNREQQLSQSTRIR